MPAATIFRDVTMTDSFAPLAAAETVGNFTFFLEGAANGLIELLGDDGVTAVEFGIDKRFTLQRVDLAKIQARYSSAGLSEKILIAGATEVGGP